MPKPKKVELQEEAEAIVEATSHKQHLYDLLEELHTLNVRSISDLENLIARS